MHYTPRFISGLQSGISSEVIQTIDIIAEVASELSNLISLGELTDVLEHEVGTNADGDSQRPLDVIADEAYLQKLKGSPVKFYASEEQEEVL